MGGYVSLVVMTLLAVVTQINQLYQRDEDACQVIRINPKRTWLMLDMPLKMETIRELRQSNKSYGMFLIFAQNPNPSLWVKLKSAISTPKKDSLRNWRDRYSASKVLAEELGSRAENGEETMFSRSAPAIYPSSLASQTRLRSQNHYIHRSRKDFRQLRRLKWQQTSH